MILPPGDTWQCLEDAFGCYKGRWENATAIQWVEGRDAAKHPVMHRTASTLQNYLTPNVSGTCSTILNNHSICFNIYAYLSYLSSVSYLNLFFFFFFLLIMLFCMLGDFFFFKLDTSFCEFYLVGCWEFFAFLKYSWALFWTHLSYLEIVWSYRLVFNLF